MMKLDPPRSVFSFAMPGAYGFFPLADATLVCQRFRLGMDRSLREFHLLWTLIYLCAESFIDVYWYPIYSDCPKPSKSDQNIAQ